MKADTSPTSYRFVRVDSELVRVVSPRGVYFVRGNACNCPGYKRHGRCKHPGMVRAYFAPAPAVPADTLASLTRAYADARAYLDATEERYLEEQAQQEACYRARVRAKRAAVKAEFMRRWSAIPAETPEQRRKRERAERIRREEGERRRRESEQFRLLVAYRDSVCGTVAK